MVQATFDFFAETKAQWLDEARYTMRKLLEKQPYVTSDDVHNICPMPKVLHPNTMGSVFSEGFKWNGFVQSKRPSAKGRYIRQWTVK